MIGESSYMAKKENVERQWFIVDATDKPLGRIASTVARVLTGKHKPTFTPHVDCGDFVIVINIDKVKFTGKKGERNNYQYYTGNTGGLRTTPWGRMRATKPVKLFESVIKGMLPKTRLKYQRKLKIYAGAAHPHAAQTPVVLEI
ncbi:MAG: 50S ribosomal protein L13 [Synergistaceae bacterium]|nr:50S ribosomal protein L13 [Synergistaceae bacterium]